MDVNEKQAGEGAFSSSAFVRAIEYLSFGAAIISAALVIFTLFMTGYSVFQRYVLDTPLTWTDEMSGFLVVAIVMLGAAETLRRGEHISVDILSSKATGWRRKLLIILSYLATAFLAAILFISTWEAVQFSYAIGVYSSGYLEAPLWIPQSFMLFGAGLLFLISIARAVEKLLKWGES